MNNGLEELDKLMETFYELCEECDCNEDMYQKHNLTSPHHIIRKKLERLEKLEKVVEILKDKFHLDIIEDGYFGCIDLDYNSINPDNLSKEEYELVKEVFGNENS